MLMNISKKLVLLLLVVLTTIKGFAQFQGLVYKQDTTTKAYAYNVEKKIAFSGGFNNPQFALGDLNNDGVQDLVIFEKGCSDIKTYINYGTSGNPDYRYRPHYAENFPKDIYGINSVTGYLKLIDYNCDGVPDLFHRGYAGISVYRGYYSNNELHFTYYKDLFYSPLTANSEDFEFTQFPPSQWSINGTGWSRQTSGSSPAATPHSGSAMARFNSANMSAGSTSLLISKRFRISYNLGQAAKVSLWMYRDNNFSTVGDSLSIYINHNVSLTNATYINRIARSISINQPDTKPTSGWYQYTFPIPTSVIGDSLYLIFKGISGGGYNIFIDSVSWITSPLNGDINAYVEPNGDVPGIADVDGDGDLDFFAYYIGGGYINFYKNYRAEEGLPCDSIRINFKDGCWGKVYQGFTQTQTLGINCPLAQPLIPPPIINPNNPNSNFIKPLAKGTHTGNTLCLLDMDGDGDYDYLDGGVSYNSIQYLKNGRLEYNYPIDTMIVQDTAWQSSGHVYDTPQFPSAFWLDINQDGKNDILISPNAESASENYHCISYYKNDGTLSSPHYTYQSDSFLVDQTIDLGTGSYPMFYDYNKDGKPDLFIGADGYFQTNGSLKAQVAYYENTSTANNPSFTLVDNDFLGIKSLNIKGAYPAVGDLDNDGVDDMVVGHSDGTISFYHNAAISNNVTPQWVLTNMILNDVNNNPIDSAQNAAPFIYDIDKDGKKDLIIGTMSGKLYYYRNTGSTNQLKLSYVTNYLGHVKVDSVNLFSAFSTPFIGRIDNTPDDYLLVGSNSGTIYRYTGFQNGNISAPFQRMDSAYSNINFSLGAYSGYRSVPAVADIDGDGKFEMVIGGISGGIKIYKQDLIINSIDGTNSIENQISVYPNPAKNTVFVNWNKSFVENNSVDISIYSIVGKKVLTVHESGFPYYKELSVRNIPAGTYLGTISSGHHRNNFKLVIIK